MTLKDGLDERFDFTLRNYLFEGESEDDDANTIPAVGDQIRGAAATAPYRA